MYRWLALLLLLCPLTSVGEAHNPRKPLDLPSGGLGDSDDEEDSPEVISFYNIAYEGDGFVWCLDRSCSMVEEFGAVRVEVNQALGQLSPQAWFGVVCFSTNVISFKPHPVRAIDTNVLSAQAWVNSLNPTGVTCTHLGGVQAVNIMNLIPRLNKRMILLSDGVPYCNGENTEEQALTDITNANYQQKPIDTLYLNTGGDSGVPFMQELSRLNNGQFNYIE